MPFIKNKVLKIPQTQVIRPVPIKFNETSFRELLHPNCNKHHQTIIQADFTTKTTNKFKEDSTSHLDFTNHNFLNCIWILRKNYFFNEREADSLYSSTIK